MKVKFESKDWFPVFVPSLDRSCEGSPFEVTPEQLARWVDAFNAFEQAQNEIRAVFEQAKAERERGKK